MTIFVSFSRNGLTNNNNVNRRFAGRELKFTGAAVDDETKKEIVIWLT
jgi:hypothetical protein